MISALYLPGLMVGAFWCYGYISRWRTNVRIASSMGLPVYISPIYFSDTWWMILYPILVPFLRALPKSWTTPWLDMAQVWDLWRAGHKPFAEAGFDSFVIATPNGNMLWSCDHAIINDLFNQHPKCDVPVPMVKFYDIWGPTIGSVDGVDWKTHRKVVTAGFGTSMNAIVWKETQQQTETMIRHIIQKGVKITDIQSWTSRLALHVLLCGFFNHKLRWDSDESEFTIKNTSAHSLAFDKAIMLLMTRLATIFMTPRWLLGLLPFKMFREANQGYTEVTKYLQEFRSSAEANIEEIAKKKHKTLLESIVLSGSDPSIAGKNKLSNASVLGNLFFTLMAGHETTGSTLAFMLRLMAIYPEEQRKVQKQLDEHFGNRPTSEWSIEQDYQALQSGHIGAVIKETLQLYNPLSFLPRCVVETVTVTDAQGQSHVIPANTFTPFAIPAAMRNPSIWKSKPNSSISASQHVRLADSPALYFNPDRWLTQSLDPTTDHAQSDLESAGTGLEAKNVSYPTWWTFGQGPRLCPGRAFASTELTAAMATLFKTHSLELVVEESTLADCEGDNKFAWERTRNEAIAILYNEVRQNLTIALARDIHVRIVPR